MDSAIDNTELTTEQTARAIQRMIESGGARLPPRPGPLD